MADFLTKAQRSTLMASIKGKANKGTELVLAALLRRHGLKGWRRHYPVAGKPDFVFVKQKVAIFVDGCFWHGCRWHYRAPTSNPEFWLNKIQANKNRDRRVTQQLRAQGWKVMRIWDHQLKNGESLIARIRALLGGSGKL